jgi:hypothetical protein
MLPAATTDGVVAWLLGGGARSWPDEQGRPLGEQASPLYASAPQREEPRRFGDARDASGLPCNVAALAQLHATWPTLLAALSAFDAGEPDTLARTFRRISAGVRLGPLLALHTRAPVPVAVAALHKVTLGFGDLCAAMLLEVRVDADQPAPRGAVLDTWLDERPWLIGATQVCAGSRAQITRVWQALRETGGEQPVVELSAPWFRDALAALLELEALAASRAGHARAALAQGVPVGPVGLALFTSGEVPLWTEALRQAPAAGVLHPSLLFASVAVPRSLQRFIDQVRGAEGVDADAALLAAAAEPAQRLARALGVVDPCPPTAAAFLDACSTGEARPVG